MAALSSSSSSPEADQLIALIASSAQTILGAYDSAGLPPPDLNAARKTSDALMTPDTRDATRILEGTCAQLCSLLAHPSHLMINNANGVRYVSAVTSLSSNMLQGIGSALIRVALECKIADHLLEGPKSAEELAKLSGVDKDKLTKVLRSLANRHIFRAGEDSIHFNRHVESSQSSFTSFGSPVSKDVYVNNRLSVTLLQEDPVSSLIGYSYRSSRSHVVHRF